jgi:hypothetical protein
MKSARRVVKSLEKRVYEGVPYTRYSVRFKTENGKRVRLFFWSPGPPWINGEVTRMLDDRGDVAAGSKVVIEEAMRR